MARLVLFVIVALVVPVRATFHFMQIEQVIAGVNGDVRAQAIQLRMRSPGQGFVSEARLFVRDATGSNPILLCAPPSNVPSMGQGARVLIATPEFAAYAGPGFSPDFIMTSPIPCEYFAAGSLTFEDAFGTVYWRLSWGGSAYTGSHVGAISNDNDGNFGPAWPTACPSSSLSALRFTGTAGAKSTTNAADYEITASASVWTKNNASAFTLHAHACRADCEGDADLDVFDFLCFQGAFASGDAYADFEGDCDLDIFDFLAFQNSFAGGC